MASSENKLETNDLGSQLKSARETVKLTQAEVASAASIHANFYARIERNEETPSIENLQKIMKVLKIKTLNLTAPEDRE